MLTRKTKRDTETESKKSPPGGMATLPPLLLHSPLRILTMHTHTPGVSLGYWVWNSNHGLLHASPATAITPTAGPDSGKMLLSSRQPHRRR